MPEKPTAQTTKVLDLADILLAQLKRGTYSNEALAELDARLLHLLNRAKKLSA